MLSVLGFGVWGLGLGDRGSGFGFRFSVFGFRVLSFVFRISCFVFRVSCFGFQFSGLGMHRSCAPRQRRQVREAEVPPDVQHVSCFVFRVSCLGFGVWGFEVEGGTGVALHDSAGRSVRQKCPPTYSTFAAFKSPCGTPIACSLRSPRSSDCCGKIARI
jgi:hypothetical protein